jgi:hypothetical protein
MNKELDIILKEMCDRVGVAFEDVDFQEHNWFTKHRWTIHQEEDFLEWLTNHLYENKEARGVILRITSKNKKLCKQGAQAFIFNYGWSYKESELTETTETTEEKN